MDVGKRDILEMKSPLTPAGQMRAYSTLGCLLAFALSLLASTGCSDSTTSNSTNPASDQSTGETPGSGDMPFGFPNYDDFPDVESSNGAGGDKDAGIESTDSDGGDGGSSANDAEGEDADQGVEEFPPESCNDLIDNDGDGKLDCEDPDCADDKTCVPPLPEDCDNNLDDDGDGQADCEDSDCATESNCLPENCGDGQDDDGDGLVDCEDPDCWDEAICEETNCVNGLDDDGDGSVDCDDPDCLTSGLCPEDDCNNGTDDDSDGFLDCEDPDCQGAENCVETDCSNGLDDDGDDLVDCEDADCIGAESCLGETCFTFYGCLLVEGCDCTPGIDCPAGDSDAASACQAACVENDSCWNGCKEQLQPEAQQNLEAWLGCIDTHCSSVSSPSLNQCVNSACLLEYAQCFSTGTESCSYYGFECGQDCETAACEELCLADLSSQGLYSALLWDNCRYGKCDTDGNFISDSLECIFISSLYACGSSSPGCLPGDFGAEGDACDVLLNCSLSCGITDENCQLACLENASFAAINQIAPVYDCVLANCGTTANSLTPTCIQSAVNGACFSVAQQCILSL